MNTHHKPLAIAVILWSAVALLGGCSSDDNGGTTQPTMPISVSGVAAKGAIDGASVNLHQFSAGGGMGNLVAGPFTTDATGAWSGEVPSGTNANLLVVVDGGSYTDESTGSTVNVTSPLYGIWRPGTAKGNASPVTHAMVLNIQKRVIDGATVASSVAAVTAAMETALGFDATALVPSHAGTKTSDKTTAQIYTAFLAGISTLLDGNPGLTGFTGADPWALVVGLLWDLSDGVLQGMDIFGDPILVDPDGAGSLTPIQLPGLDVDDISVLVAAANLWASNAGWAVTVPDIDLSDFVDINITPGEAMVSGTLAVSGSDMEQFGSTYAPTIVGYSENTLVAAFALGNLQVRAMGISVILAPLTVITVSTSDGELAWVATGSLPGGAVPGISATRSANVWTLVFNDLNMAGTQGTTGNLIFNGPLTVTLAP